MGYNARKIAVDILANIEEGKAFSNIEINKKVKGIKDPRDENLIREIVYGVLENKLLLDKIITKLSKTKFNKIDNTILQILRIGIYQIKFLDSIPDRAACNESVNLAKQFGKKRLSGYVNGILRNFSRNKDKDYLPKKADNLIEYLSVKYSHPEWIVKNFINDYGEEFTEELLIANNQKPPLTIRTNTNKISRNDLIDLLEKHDILARATNYSRDGILVENPIRITELNEFKEGYFTIQDESSMLVAEVLNPIESSEVLDICSGPGGKATHIGEKMHNKGTIIARDIYDHKLELIDNNASRLGIHIINTEKYDALDFDEDLIDKMDSCLVDAPCSGLGLLRRKPDIRWNKEIGDLETLSEMQIRILQNSSKYVKRDGILIYSTCTITKEENINVIKKFLSSNNNYTLQSIEIPNLNCKTAKDGYIELFPNLHGTDGFFIAKLKRIS